MSAEVPACRKKRAARPAVWPAPRKHTISILSQRTGFFNTPGGISDYTGGVRGYSPRRVCRRCRPVRRAVYRLLPRGFSAAAQRKAAGGRRLAGWGPRQAAGRTGRRRGDRLDGVGGAAAVQWCSRASEGRRFGAAAGRMEVGRGAAGQQKNRLPGAGGLRGRRCVCSSGVGFVKTAVRVWPACTARRGACRR